MVDIGNSILKTLKGIKFLSLPVSILYTIFVLFWLVLNSSLVNITNFVLWNANDLYSLTQRSHCIPLAWHNDFLVFVHLVHQSGLLRCWSYLHSSPEALAYCFEMILLSEHIACVPKSWGLLLSMCRITILTLVYI